MKNILKEPSMEEYAKKRKKDKSPKIRDVTVKKADGGYIVEINEEYSETKSIGESRKPSVYKDLEGVYQCLADKFGGD